MKETEKLLVKFANLTYEALQIEVRLEETQAELQQIKAIIDSDADLKALFESVQEEKGGN